MSQSEMDSSITTPKRPRRSRKDDRLFNRHAGKAEVAADTALAPFDRAAGEADRKWGMDRLVELVPPAMAAKYGTALGALNEAIERNDLAAIIDNAANCIRGIEAMDKHATEAGKQPMPPKAMEIEYNGRKFCVVEKPADLQFYSADKNAMVFTLREIAVLMEAAAKSDGIAAVKDNFPEARITSAVPKLPDEFWTSGGDPIDFMEAAENDDQF